MLDTITIAYKKTNYFSPFTNKCVVLVLCFTYARLSLIVGRYTTLNFRKCISTLVFTSTAFSTISIHDFCLTSKRWILYFVSIWRSE